MRVFIWIGIAVALLLAVSLLYSFRFKNNETPNSNKVQITQQAPLVLAVIRFGGFASQNKIQEQADLLTQTLKEKNIQIKGALLFMGYNAPWDVTGRRNEVAYEVEGFTP